MWFLDCDWLIFVPLLLHNYLTFPWRILLIYDVTGLRFYFLLLYRVGNPVFLARVSVNIKQGVGTLPFYGRFLVQSCVYPDHIRVVWSRFDWRLTTCVEEGF